MNKYKVFENLFKEFYKSENIILDAEMKNYVHFRVGGPADIVFYKELGMNKYKVFENLFKEFYKSENIILDAEMKNYVHFRVGGPADILLIPENKEQIIRTIEICNEKTYLST